MEQSPLDGSYKAPAANTPSAENIRLLMSLLDNHLGRFEEYFDAFVHEFTERARQERTERRANISRTNPGVERSFSPNVIAYRFHHGTVELGWTEIWYRPGDSTPRFRRLPMRRGVTNIASVVRRAHPDEVDLLRSHEEESRKYRSIWSDYLALRRQIGHFRRKANKVTEELQKAVST